MDGLIKCSIIPAQRLHHPVLPFRCNKKLLLCLCRSCALTSASGECEHTEYEERALTGTWVLDDVRLAVENGYKILKINEVYEYKVTEFTPDTDDGGLFVDYINTFLKLKWRRADIPTRSETLRMSGMSKCFGRVKESD